MNTVEKKQQKNKLIQEQRAFLRKADDEKRGLTDQEKRKFDGLSDDIDELEKDILQEEADLERRRKLAERDILGRKSKDGVDPEKEFRNVGEFFLALARMKSDGVKDARLDALYEKREQTMGTGATGGYALPEQFDDDIRQVQAQESTIRARATVIPAGTPPDAKLTFPSLDQTSAQNIYGGVTLVHTGEGVTMSETSLALREISLEPKEISGYIVVTQKLLNNWVAAGAFLTKTLSQAMMGQEDFDFMRGNGVNKALGFINSAAAISYTRAGANAIAFGDCYGMLARILMRGGSKGGSYIWLASQTIIPQLAAMVDAGSHAVWIGGFAGGLPGAAGPLPSSLLGLPVIFSDRLPVLGTKGDLSLVNLSYYFIKDGSGPAVASSEHILFLSNKVVFKVVWNVDGHPWLTEPLQLEGSTSNTVSPFVVLSDA